MSTIPTNARQAGLHADVIGESVQAVAQKPPKPPLQGLSQWSYCGLTLGIQALGPPRVPKPASPVR